MSRKVNKQMNLTMFLVAFGYHNDAWIHPDSRAEEIGGMDIMRDIAQASERAKLDAIFIADSYSSRPLFRGGYRGASIYEPIATIGALIGHTDKLGMIGTQSTTFNEPYSVARQFATLDRLSGGRIGWNIVTSAGGEENFGRELPAKEDRYDRAMEFVNVVEKLWDSWDRDAIVTDRERGEWVATDRIHRINHVGKHFRVEGPLSIPRSPQERPVLVQAGQSPDGIELGSSYADIIYTVQPDKDRAMEFYSMYKQKVRDKGRNDEKVRILPGIMPILGRTQAEAEELAKELENCVNESNGRRMLENLTRADLSDLELTDKIPLERLVFDPSGQERWHLFRQMAEEKTVWELMVHLSRAVGHRVMISTPDKVAESMIEWFSDRACDGYNLNIPNFPEGMHRIFDLLIPELQERGFFREDYVGDTMRERSGLTVEEESLRALRASYIDLADTPGAGSIHSG